MAINLQMPLAEGSLLDHVVWHKLSHEPVMRLFGKDIYFSSHQFMLLMAGFFTLVVFLYIGQKAKTQQVPTGLHNFFEAMLSFLRTEVFRPALKENTDRFAPLLWTFFFFILFCNVLGLIPVAEIASLFTRREMHFWGTATGNLLVTAGLAIMAFIMIHVMGVTQQIRIAMDPSLDPHSHHTNDHMRGEAYSIEEHSTHDKNDVGHGPEAGVGFAMAVPVGIGRYIWNFAPHPDTGIKIMDLGLFLLLLVLEMIGALVKPFALCIRLFANMIAGHLVLGALVSLVPFTAGLAMALGVSIPVALGCAALSILELFVAFLQAYIFVFLTTLFLASAVSPEH